MTEQTPQRIGKAFWILTWISLLGLLYLFFSSYLDDRQRPNRDLVSSDSGQVVLKRNRGGHCVAPGLINDYPVRFLLDTGATSVSIPEKVAAQIGLQRGPRYQVTTASGRVDVYSTTLDSIQLGGIVLQDIRGHINPHMPGETVLLGMSFMQHLELNQKGDTLTLRY